MDDSGRMIWTNGSCSFSLCARPSSLEDGGLCLVLHVFPKLEN